MKSLIRFVLLAAALLPWIAAQAQPDPQTQSGGSASFVVVTHVDLLPDSAVPNGVETGIQLLKDYVQNTTHASGARSAQLITWAPTNNHFQIIEVWNNRAAFEAHIGTASAIAFRNSLQGLIGSPYEQRLYYSSGTQGGWPHGDATKSPF